MPRVDQPVFFDTQFVAEHATHIYEHCLATQSKGHVNLDYMASQYDINSQMRAILIDWLVEVHLKFKLLPETLYLTVNLIDRFLSVTQIVRSKLQLVGVTCLLIACKYEEIYPPIVSDVVYITDNAYKAAEILEMERNILVALDFDLHVTSPYRFFERFCYLTKPTDNEVHFAQYMMEGSLVAYNMLKYPPSILAASALYFAGKMCRNTNLWSPKVTESSHIKESELRVCAKDLIKEVLNFNMSKNQKLKAVYNKYSAPKFGCVSLKVPQNAQKNI